MAAELIDYVPLVIPLAVSAWYLYKRFKKPKDIDVPEPVALRTDLLYGYYGTVGTQAADTLGSVNLLWEAQWGGPDKVVDNILTAKTFTVLDLGLIIYEKFAPSGRNHRLYPNFEQLLRERLSIYHTKDVLQYIKALVIIDEPNTNVISKEDFQLAINGVKRVVKEFPELDNVKYACIYAAKPIDYWCIEEFDYVGLDDYDELSGIFTNGIYERITSRMRPDSKTILLPGGGFGQALKPFWNYAHNNKEVGMLIPFTWLDGEDPRDTWIGLGNDKNPRKQEYLDYGKIIFNLNQK